MEEEKVMANNKTTKAPKQTVEVLYQNLNGTWYAFATIGEHIFVGKVPQKAPKNGDVSQIKLKKAFSTKDFDATNIDSTDVEQF